MLIERVVNGIILGSMYALIAQGYTLVFGVLDKLNFAHGEIFMLGGFLCLTSLALGAPLVVAFIFAIVVPLANAMKTPALNFTALKPGISKKPFALRIHPNDAMMIPEGVSQFLKKFPNVKTVVVRVTRRRPRAHPGYRSFSLRRRR